MVKVVLTIEDDFKDGQSVIKGRFDTEGAPEPMNGLPAQSTPAQLYMDAIKRLCDAGTFNTLIRLVCPDLLYKNDMIKQARMKAMAEAGAALVQQRPGGAPANDASPIDKVNAVDAEVVDPAQKVAEGITAVEAQQPDVPPAPAEDPAVVAAQVAAADAA
jgi:hypothetical protein